MARRMTKSCRLSTMLFLTASFFLVEIIVGYVTNSIALVADSFHMLSDVVALIVGFASVRISKWPSKRNTYGWVRAEILGALVNAVFLLALCFSILVEALKRLVEVEEVDNPKLLLIVGGAGLLINVIGLVLFSGHGHSHGGGGHGHSHGGHGHSHNHREDHAFIEGQQTVYKDGLNGGTGQPIENESLVTPDSMSTDTDKEIYVSQAANITIEIKKPKLVQTMNRKMPASSNQLNMRGVFLHVMGDALGSVVVIVSALVIMFAEGSWKYYVDPAMSVCMVLIILGTTIPLLKESAFILLQTVPSHVDVENIITELEQMDGIYDVHECHIWQLAGNRIVASAHIRCHGIEEYMTLATKIKDLFHKAGIHSTTIQPEFIDWQEANSEQQPCALLCSSVDTCKPDTCCGDRKGRLEMRNSNTSNKQEDNPEEPIAAVCNSNNSNVSRPARQNFSSTRSLDMKFSPDGDEVVLEMSEIKSVEEEEEGLGSKEKLSSSGGAELLSRSHHSGKNVGGAAHV